MFNGVSQVAQKGTAHGSNGNLLWMLLLVPYVKGNVQIHKLNWPSASNEREENSRIIKKNK